MILLTGGDVINGFEKCRKAAGLTQVEASKELKVAQCTISQWENGNCAPIAAKLVAIAKLYGCTVDDLLRAKEE